MPACEHHEAIDTKLQNVRDQALMFWKIFGLTITLALFAFGWLSGKSASMERLEAVEQKQAWQEKTLDRRLERLDKRQERIEKKIDELSAPKR